MHLSQMKWWQLVKIALESQSETHMMQEGRNENEDDDEDEDDFCC